MSRHSQILAELGYKQRTNQEAGFRSDGQPYANRAQVSAEKRRARQLSRLIEDHQLAKELGLSVQDLRAAL
ncbi:hypothetical protein [Shewanella xiamenensis]|uniref:hypothetical protein n=1 Tax=Shewanella xiamenensis TaxID=332186 RepID=UPI00313EEE59